MKNVFLLLVASLLLFSCNKTSNKASTAIKPKFISDQQFEESVLASDGLVVVDFWAGWCGPCKMMDPTIQSFANEYKDVKFVKIDVDKHRQIKEQYSVNGLPTLMFFKDGKELSRQVGLTTEGTVRNKIERWR